MVVLTQQRTRVAAVAALIAVSLRWNARMAAVAIAGAAVVVALFGGFTWLPGEVAAHGAR